MIYLYSYNSILVSEKEGEGEGCAYVFLERDLSVRQHHSSIIWLAFLSLSLLPPKSASKQLTYRKL